MEKKNNNMEMERIGERFIFNGVKFIERDNFNKRKNMERVIRIENYKIDN
jgi:hypothetical protein